MLLAHRDRWCDSVLATTLERRTERTITDPLSLRSEIEVVRTDRYATGSARRLRTVAASRHRSSKPARRVAALQIYGVGINEYVAPLVVRNRTGVQRQLGGRGVVSDFAGDVDRELADGLARSGYAP